MENQKFVDISSISIWKRILVHLADLFLTFIISFILVNTLTLPVGKSIIKYNEKTDEILNCQSQRLDVLYGNNLMFYEDETSKDDFNASFSYTFDNYLSYFVKGQTGKEIFANYYVDIKNDKSTLINLYITVDENNDFFDITDSVQLKPNYISIFDPYFDEQDSLVDASLSKLNQFKNRIYSQLYAEMIKSIERDDLLYNNKSYVNLLNKEEKIVSYIDNFYTIGTYIGYLLTIVFFFILFPMFLGDGRTIGMICLKVHNVDSIGLKEHLYREILVYALFSIISNLALSFLLPAMTVGIEASFALPCLVVISVISILFNLVSLIVMLFNEHNRPISDLLSNSVIITEDDYDKIVFERVKK